jgi:hypothetical protein
MMSTAQNSKNKKYLRVLWCLVTRTADDIFWKLMIDTIFTAFSRHNITQPLRP